MNLGRQVNAAPAGFSVAPSGQPPRILVIVINTPHWTHTCHKLCDALENVFTLACSLTGPPRIPLFSIYVVQAHPECLLPFVAVKRSFSRLQSCLAELRAYPADGGLRPKTDAVAQAVQDGLQQFKQYTGEGMAGCSLNSSSVEITVLTSQPSTEMAKQLEDGLHGINLVGLRQLQVVEISREEVQAPANAESDWRNQAQEGPDGCEGAMVLRTIMDLQVVENDMVALESFFKGWFHDHSASREHLHLLLPIRTASHSGAPRDNSVCVKCDVQERLLSPALLPASSWGIHGTARAEVGAVTASSSGPSWLAVGQGTAATPRVLRVLRALTAEGLCASVVFGLPLVVTPTSCWQLTWDELESNQQRFQALCHFLQSILDGLEVEPVYNPLRVTTHLYRALRSILGRPSTLRAQRLAEHPLPRQQGSRLQRSKARAMVAPLPMVMPVDGRGTLSQLSREEDFVDQL